MNDNIIPFVPRPKATPPVEEPRNEVANCTIYDDGTSDYWVSPECVAMEDFCWLYMLIANVTRSIMDLQDERLGSTDG